MNARQATRENRSTGPVWFFESRTRTQSSEQAASRQLSLSAPLLVLLRHTSFLPCSSTDTPFAPHPDVLVPHC